MMDGTSASASTSASVYRERDYLAERGPGHKNCLKTWSVFRKRTVLPADPRGSWRQCVGRFLYSKPLLDASVTAAAGLRRKVNQAGKLREELNNLLWEPVSFNDVEGIEAALLRGARPDARDPEGNTALLLCAERGFEVSLEFLLRHCTCDVNAQNKLGSTALHLTCRGVECSWRPGLSKYSTESSSRRGQVETVRDLGRGRMVELLLWAGGDVTLVDKMGAQPLHVACSYGNEDCIVKLLEAKADLRHRARTGRTPLDELLACSHREARDGYRAHRSFIAALEAFDRDPDPKKTARGYLARYVQQQRQQLQPQQPSVPEGKK